MNYNYMHIEESKNLDHHSKSDNKNSAINKVKNANENVIQLFVQNPPTLYCYKHQNPIILFCLRPHCQYKNRLCSKCVSQQLEHINLHTPLSVPQQFWNYLNDSKDEQQIIQILKYELKIQFPHKQLDSLIKNKFAERINLFLIEKSEEFIQQNQAFKREQNYLQSMKYYRNDLNTNEMSQQFIQKIKSDLSIEEKQAEVKKFIDKKQGWENTSKQILTYFQKCATNYKIVIQKTLKKPPSFDVNKMKKTFLLYLNNAFDLMQQECFIENSISNERNYIPLNIQSKSELQLITPCLIKPHTKIILNFQKDKFEADQIIFKKIATYSIQSLHIYMNKSNLPSPLAAFLPITCRQYYFDFSEINNLNSSLYYISWMFQQIGRIHLNDDNQRLLIQNIISMTFIVSENALYDEGITQIIQILVRMVNLEKIGLDLSRNEFSLEGIKKINQIYSKFQKLDQFKLCINNNKTKIDDSTFIQLISEIDKLKNMIHLNLSFSQNKLTNSAISYLIDKLSNFRMLVAIQINLSYNTGISVDMLQQLLKVISKKKQLSLVKLNFEGLSLKQSDIISITDKLLNFKSISGFQFKCKPNLLQKQRAQQLKNQYSQKCKELNIIANIQI